MNNNNKKAIKDFLDLYIPRYAVPNYPVLKSMWLNIHELSNKETKLFFITEVILRTPTNANMDLFHEFLDFIALSDFIHQIENDDIDYELKRHFYNAIIHASGIHHAATSYVLKNNITIPDHNLTALYHYIIGLSEGDISLWVQAHICEKVRALIFSVLAMIALFPSSVAVKKNNISMQKLRNMIMLHFSDYLSGNMPESPLFSQIRFPRWSTHEITSMYLASIRLVYLSIDYQNLDVNDIIKHVWILSSDNIEVLLQYFTKYNFSQDWVNHLLSFQDINPLAAMSMSLHEQHKSMLLSYVASRL